MGRAYRVRGVGFVMCALVAAALVWSGSASAQDASDEEGAVGVGSANLQLRVNRTRVVNVPDVSHVSVGNGDILQVKVIDESDDVVLIGLRAGITDVRFWQDGRDARGYRVTVRPADRVIGERPDAEQLQALINSGLKGRKSDIRITEGGNSLNIHGKATSAAQLSRITALADRFDSVYAYVEEPDIEERDTVFIEAQFIEVTETGLENIGLDWDDAIDGPVFAAANDFDTNDLFRVEYAGLPGVDQSTWPLDIGSTKNFSGWGFQLSSIVNLLVEDGQARVLAEPVLSALSGEEADFHSGGEIPIPTQGEDGEITTEFREFGIQLKVKPVTNKDRDVQTEVAVEVSDVDFARTVRGIPAIDSSRAETIMVAPSGRSLVIAGLVNKESSKTVNKIPFIGDIPILGEFFKTRRLDSERSELIVVVTPHIGGMGSQFNRSLLKRSGDLADRSRSDTRFHIMD